MIKLKPKHLGIFVGWLTLCGLAVMLIYRGAHLLGQEYAVMAQQRPAEFSVFPELRDYWEKQHQQRLMLAQARRPRAVIMIALGLALLIAWTSGALLLLKSREAMPKPSDPSHRSPADADERDKPIPQSPHTPGE